MDLKVTFPGGKKVDAELGDHKIRSDQPQDEGGENTAPSPFDYCLAAMGTCAGFYVLAYLQARDLPTDNVSIVQSNEWDEKSHRLTKVSMRIIVPPEIPEKHHKVLVRSASKCSVKKLIESEPEFVITAETAGS